MNFRRKYHRSGWENKILDMKSTKCHIYVFFSGNIFMEPFEKYVKSLNENSDA